MPTIYTAPSIEHFSMLPEGHPAAELQTAGTQLYNGLLQGSVVPPGHHFMGGGSVSFLTGQKAGWRIPAVMAPRVTMSEETDGALRVAYEQDTHVFQRAPAGIYDTTVYNATVQTLILGGYSGRGVSVGSEAVKLEIMRTGSYAAGDEVIHQVVTDRRELQPQKPLSLEECSEWAARLQGYYTVGRQNAAQAHEVRMRAQGQGLLARALGVLGVSK